MKNLKVNHIILIAAILGSFLGFKLLWSCEGKIYNVAKKNWSRDRYKLYLFYKADSPDSEPLLSLLEQKRKAWWPKANIRIFKIDILKVEDKYNKIVEKYPPTKIPEIIIISPNGELVSRINSSVNSQTLERIISSHKRKEIVQNLNEKGALFLCLLNKKDQKRNKEILKTVKEVTKKCEIIFNQVIPIVELYRDDPYEEILIHNVAVLSNNNQSNVFLIFGKGKIISKESDSLSQERLIDQVQIINHNCSCTINPIEFGTDLLLTWE